MANMSSGDYSPSYQSSHSTHNSTHTRTHNTRRPERRGLEERNQSDASRGRSTPYNQQEPTRYPRSGVEQSRNPRRFENERTHRTDHRDRANSRDDESHDDRRSRRDTRRRSMSSDWTSRRHNFRHQSKSPDGGSYRHDSRRSSRLSTWRSRPYDASDDDRRARRHDHQRSISPPQLPRRRDSRRSSNLPTRQPRRRNNRQRNEPAEETPKHIKLSSSDEIGHFTKTEEAARADIRELYAEHKLELAMIRAKEKVERLAASFLNNVTTAQPASTSMYLQPPLAPNDILAGVAGTTDSILGSGQNPANPGSNPGEAVLTPATTTQDNNNIGQDDTGLARTKVTNSYPRSGLEESPYHQSLPTEKAQAVTAVQRRMTEAQGICKDQLLLAHQSLQQLFLKPPSERVSELPLLAWDADAAADSVQGRPTGTQLMIGGPSRKVLDSLPIE